MDMKFGINKTNLSKAFIARDKEIFALRERLGENDDEEE